MLSIGVHYNKGNWKTCLMENGHTLELRLFKDVCAALEYVQFHCAIFPEPVITLSINSGTYLTPVHTYAEGQLSEKTLNSDHIQREDDLNTFRIAVGSSSHNTFHLPPLNQLPDVPIFRRQHRLDMGGSDTLCATALLLYRLRRQEAIWQEMRFLYVDAGYDARSIVVVEDGRIVNGIGETSATYCSQATSLERNEPANWSDHLEQEALVKQAFWEGLTQDLAGLMAIHHLEDIVVTGQLKEAVIEKLEDRYQFYLFPYNEHEQVGFEAAIGAAIIAEGLYRPGLAAEVVERLQITYGRLE